MKPKIAIVGTRGYPYVYSGYETFVRELVERLNKKYEFHIYCHRGLFNNKPAIVNEIHLHYIPSIEMKSLSQFSHSLLSTLHSILSNYDAYLYVNTANGPFGYLTRLFRKKTAINTDGVEWLRPKWKGLGKKYFYWASKISTKSFDTIISDSQAMASLYKKLFNASSEVIAYGATIQYTSGSKEIEKFGLNKDDYYLIVGRLIPDNNADVIVEGFKKSKSTKKLVIVGDVPYKDNFVERIKKNKSDNIIFTGYITDQTLLKEMYANAFCYFHGHEFGGTNPTLLKALAYGCCVLALDTVFSKEVLANDKYGMYFIKKPDSIAELINRVENNMELITHYKSISRERITSYYTWEKIAKQYDMLFCKMLQN